MEIESQPQQRFFELLSSSIPANFSLVDVLCDSLNLTEASAYRRIKGDTPLRFDEIITLCNQFGISFDQFIHEKPGNQGVNFQNLGIKQSPPDLKNYLKILLELIRSSKGGSQYLYAAKDVPVFHLFQYPELTAFKLFFWRKSNFDDPGLRQTKFSLAQYLEDYQEEIAIARQIALLYGQFSVVEIWNEETTSSYFKQILYYLQAQLFEDPNDARILCDQLVEMYQHILEEATTGYKTMPGSTDRLGPYHLYKNDLVVIDNAIHIQYEGKSTVFTTYNLINYLATEDTAFCEEVHGWLARLISKSDAISQHTEKERNRFFTQIFRRSDKVYREVLAQIE